MFKAIAITATLFVSSFAHAIVMPGFHRPLMSAEMKISQAVGIFQDVQTAEVTLARKDSSKIPTAINLVVDGELVVLPVVSVEYDDCGSLVIVASDNMPDNTNTLILQDNRTRLCEDVRSAVWEVRVENVGLGAFVLGQMELLGNPEPVMSIQVEQVF